MTSAEPEKAARSPGKTIALMPGVRNMPSAVRLPDSSVTHAKTSRSLTKGPEICVRRVP